MNDSPDASGAATVPNSIAVAVNGSPRRIASGTTIATMLAEMNVRTSGIAVAVNERVVPASAHDTHRLHDGDAVEIVRATSGG